MNLNQAIINYVNSLEPEIIQHRRDFHKHPESGWTEFRTTSIIASYLVDLGYSVAYGQDIHSPQDMMGVPSPTVLEQAQARAIEEGASPELVAHMKGGFTGVVATKEFSTDGPTIALRFDIDANDVSETNNPEHYPNQNGFASIHINVMHACGHDGHTSVGMAIAKTLINFQSQLKGRVKLIFQPAEEGVRGARAIVEKGIVDNVDYMLGSHFGFQMKQTGQIACNVTGFLATTKYDAYFTGAPAHAGAAPEGGRNALLAAACATLNLHAIPRHSAGVSRINVGTLEAGSGRNVIGDKALLKLETRGATSAINDYMESSAATIIQAAASMYNVDVTINKVGGAAGGSNSPLLAKLIQEEAQSSQLFTEIVGDCDFGASEDYSYFMERVQQQGGQAAYIMIGANLAAGHHNSCFDFDETALAIATKFLTMTTAKLLTENKISQLYTKTTSSR